MAYEPLMDILKSKRQDNESQLSADMRTQSNDRSLLAGATPLLVGLLAGDMSSGVSVASDGLIKEDARLMKQQGDYAKAMAKKGSASDPYKSALVKVTLANGKTKYMTRKEAHAMDSSGLSTQDQIDKSGKESRAKAIGSGSNISLTKDEQGRQAYSNKLTKRVEPINGQSSITPKFKEVRDKRYTQLSSRVKPDIDSLRTAQRGLDLSMQTGMMPKMVALNMAVKVTEARATDEDYNRVINNRSRIQRIKESLKEEKNAEVSKRKIKEAQALFKQIMDTAGKSLKSSIDSSARSISENDEQYENASKFFGDLMPSYGEPMSKKDILDKPISDFEDMTAEQIEEVIKQAEGK